MRIIKREEYLKKLRSLKDQNVIKVITGVRRCGKSTLLKMFFDELAESGVSKKRLQYINFEDPKYSYDVNWKDIYDDIDKALVKEQMNYVFLDEVQYIEDFERLLVGLQTKENVDLYVTGSNAHMLSSELATLLSGRSVEISILPLSFREYVELFDGAKLLREELFSNYMSFGGFPQAASIFEGSQEMVDSYLSGVYETVVGRDIMDRGVVTDKITLNAVTRYLLDNIGNATSAHAIAAELGESDRKVSQVIEAVTSSFLFYALRRFDIKGKEVLKTQEKYYTVDLGLRWAMLGRDAAADMGHILENIVYLELLRRGGKVFVGKVGEKEIDFIVKDTAGNTEYYQVAWSVKEKKTLERELAPLKKAGDFNHRYLITMDAEELSYEGIRQVNAVKWLMGE